MTRNAAKHLCHFPCILAFVLAFPLDMGLIAVSPHCVCTLASPIKFSYSWTDVCPPASAFVIMTKNGAQQYF